MWDSVMVKLACPCMSTLDGSDEKHWYNDEIEELTPERIEELRVEHKKICQLST
jgi:hypothetical protein